VSPLFESETYSKGILKGIISSSGGLTESTLKESTEVLLKYMQNISKWDNHLEKTRAFLRQFIDIFEQNLKVEWLTVPLMKTLETLISSNYITEAELEPEMI